MATRKRQGSGRHRDKPDPLAKQVGSRIAQLRHASSITFDAFVGETELGRGYVSELERGLVVPGLHVLHRVALALNLTVADLVVGDSARERLFDAARGLSDSQVRRLVERVRRLAKANEGES